MKTSLQTLGTALLLSLAACAGESDSSESDLTKTKVEVALASLSYDSGTTMLNSEYEVGGGCADHRAVTLLKVTEGRKGEIKVFDEVKGVDNCEALLQQSSKAVVSDLLKKNVPAGSEDRSRSFTIKLPAVNVPMTEAVDRTPAPSPPADSFDITSLGRLSVDRDGLLKYGFSIGGGCGTHKSFVVVDLVKGGEEVTAKVSIKHATDDICEGLMIVDEQADLGKLVSAAFIKEGLELQYQVKVELPAVDAEIRNN